MLSNEKLFIWAKTAKAKAFTDIKQIDCIPFSKWESTMDLKVPNDH